MGRRRPTPSPLLVGTLPALLLSTLLSGCAAAVPKGLPPDVPDATDVEVVSGKGFRLFVDGDCLSEQAAGDLSELPGLGVHR